MSNEAYKDFKHSGRQLIEDTKIPRKATVKPHKLSSSPEESGDPHKVFTKRTIAEKPKKADVVKEFERFIKVAEDLL